MENSVISKTPKNINNGLQEHMEKVVIEGLSRDFYGGSAFDKMDCVLDENDEEYLLQTWRDAAGWEKYERIFRDLFYTLFEPCPPIAKLFEDKMQSANLVPGKFSTSHYRAFDGIRHKKHVVNKKVFTQKSRNAINCASFAQPGDPTFFASDSLVAVSFARDMMMNGTETNNNINTNNTNKNTTDHRKNIVVFDEAKEAVHFDKKYQWTWGNVSDFYPTFVDILIMSEAKCVSHEKGGFGIFANALMIAPTV
jgi:hypothetical protein